jgi:hypothetical protein
MLHLTQLLKIHHSDNSNEQCVISGLCHEVDEKGALFGNFAASSCNSLPLFSDNLWVPPSSFEGQELDSWPLKMDR